MMFTETGREGAAEAERRWRGAVRSQVTVMFNNDYHHAPAAPTLIN